MSHFFRSVIAISLVAAAFAAPLPRWANALEEQAGTAEAKPSRAQREFFENKVRPLLAENCYRCHGPKKQKSGLRLDTRATSLAGGESGPAVIPGQPDESLLIEAINYKSFQMPPTGKLKDREIAVLTQWIQMGAPWPDDKSVRVKVRRGEYRVTEADRNYWAFQPVKRPSLPAVKQIGRASSPIDAFILAKLEEQGFEPNLPADKRTLIRRAYYDLIGLPPTSDESEAFLADQSFDAYEKVIDRLLSRKQYGERWARHWLDVVRFGQTNGYERDGEKPFAWRYRDYVIKAFNEDKPFNRFILEQLAGDELDDVTHDSIIATGFYRLGVWDDEPDDRLLAEFEELDEMVRTTGATFLGLTLGCARCHNHMFDPIPQADYYRLLAFFRNVALYGKDEGALSLAQNSESYLTPLIDKNQSAAWKAKQQRIKDRIQLLQAKVGEIGKLLGKQAQAEKKQTQQKKQKLEADLKKAQESLQHPPFEQALSVRELGPTVKKTHVLIRGNPRRAGKPVEPRLPVVFGGRLPKPPVRTLEEMNEFRHLLAENGVKPTSGRRRALAEWIAGDDHPLTARVMVNRLWQHHFGRGIVRTSNNFGKVGFPPTHPKLLDWLAAELVEGGWKLKRLHKLIMLSDAYQMSSKAGSETAMAQDPGNELFWRQNMRRLDAEALRDSVLLASGRLNFKMGGRGIFPNLSKDVLATQSRPGSGWGKSDEAERSRRSIYIFIKRTLMVPMLETFDYTNTAESLDVRPVTTVAPQALLLLNSRFMQEQAGILAERIIKETGLDDLANVERTFLLALGRRPTSSEQQIALEMLRRESQRFQPQPQQPANAHSIDKEAQRQALRSLCLVVLNLNEFIYLD